MANERLKTTAGDNSQLDKLSTLLRALLGSLIGLFVSGVTMTAIGQPTSTHKLSSGGNTFWHIILGLHLLFLVVLTISAISVLTLTFSKFKDLRARFAVGMLVVVFGIISGTLVLHKIHPGIFLFCMAMSFLVIGLIYGPIAGHGRRKR